ncbi:MAG TPA: septum formation initiator family protein [Candidatus Omnitrophica bacterium]|nr:septum formation initiator family protein [Candidatus Omnitrophota bacterium]
MASRIRKKIIKGLILVVILGIIYYPGYRRIQEMRYENEKLANQLEELRNKNAKLEEKLKRLQTDITYIEKRAREELGLANKGEIIYEFVPQEEKKQ